MKCIHQSMEVFPYKYDAGGGFSLGLEKSWLRRWEMQYMSPFQPVAMPITVVCPPIIIWHEPFLIKIPHHIIHKLENFTFAFLAGIPCLFSLHLKHVLTSDKLYKFKHFVSKLICPTFITIQPLIHPPSILRNLH